MLDRLMLEVALAAGANSYVLDIKMLVGLFID